MATMPRKPCRSRPVVQFKSGVWCGPQTRRASGGLVGHQACDIGQVMKFGRVQFPGAPLRLRITPHLPDELKKELLPALYYTPCLASCLTPRLAFLFLVRHVLTECVHDRLHLFL